ncbi:serine/arginine repetitive matrix protein 1-like [Macrobrachium nipponense]|uniref:serine/arginine repetitive matrix protein 1-like n=1 Tax=Macrobrachium nipponense TaxID=159736 RepID=UPI0030C7CD8E
MTTSRGASCSPVGVKEREALMTITGQCELPRPDGNLTFTNVETMIQNVDGVELNIKHWGLRALPPSATDRQRSQGLKRRQSAISASKPTVGRAPTKRHRSPGRPRSWTETIACLCLQADGRQRSHQAPPIAREAKVLDGDNRPSLPPSRRSVMLPPSATDRQEGQGPGRRQSAVSASKPKIDNAPTKRHRSPGRPRYWTETIGHLCLTADGRHRSHQVPPIAREAKVLDGDNRPSLPPSRRSAALPPSATRSPPGRPRSLDGDNQPSLPPSRRLAELPPSATDRQGGQDPGQRQSGSSASQPTVGSAPTKRHRSPGRPRSGTETISSLYLPANNRQRSHQAPPIAREAKVLDGDNQPSLPPSRRLLALPPSATDHQGGQGTGQRQVAVSASKLTVGSTPTKRHRSPGRPRSWTETIGHLPPSQWSTTLPPSATDCQGSLGPGWRQSAVSASQMTVGSAPTKRQRSPGKPSRLLAALPPSATDRQGSLGTGRRHQPSLPPSRLLAAPPKRHRSPGKPRYWTEQSASLPPSRCWQRSHQAPPIARKSLGTGRRQSAVSASQPAVGSAPTKRHRSPGKPRYWTETISRLCLPAGCWQRSHQAPPIAREA